MCLALTGTGSSLGAQSLHLLPASLRGPLPAITLSPSHTPMTPACFRLRPLPSPPGLAAILNKDIAGFTQSQTSDLPIKPGKTAAEGIPSLCKLAMALLTEPGKGLPSLQESKVVGPSRPAARHAGGLLPSWQSLSSRPFSFLSFRHCLCFLTCRRSLSLLEYRFSSPVISFATVSPVSQNKACSVLTE